MQTICLVDDNPDILVIFALFFRKNGYHVLTAGSGQDCIDMIRTYPPDLVLLDVMMEPIDGWQTLVHIKKNPETCHIPVIMVSGKKPTQEEIQIYGKSFEYYVMKPVSFSSLLDKVATILPPLVAQSGH